MLPAMDTCLQHILARNISSLRAELGLSKIDFCLQTGISRVLLDHIESGHANLKLSTLERIATALGKEAWELLR